MASLIKSINASKVINTIEKTCKEHVINQKLLAGTIGDTNVLYLKMMQKCTRGCEIFRYVDGVYYYNRSDAVLENDIHGYHTSLNEYNTKLIIKDITLAIHVKSYDLATFILEYKCYHNVEYINILLKLNNRNITLWMVDKYPKICELILPKLNRQLPTFNYYYISMRYDECMTKDVLIKLLSGIINIPELSWLYNEYPYAFDEEIHMLALNKMYYNLTKPCNRYLIKMFVEKHSDKITPEIIDKFRKSIIDKSKQKIIREFDQLIK